MAIKNPFLHAHKIRIICNSSNFSHLQYFASSYIHQCCCLMHINNAVPRSLGLAFSLIGGKIPWQRHRLLGQGTVEKPCGRGRAFARATLMHISTKAFTEWIGGWLDGIGTDIDIPSSFTFLCIPHPPPPRPHPRWRKGGEEERAGEEDAERANQFLLFPSPIS